MLLCLEDRGAFGIPDCLVVHESVVSRRPGVNKPVVVLRR